jgi:hypothetical protein
MSKHREGGIMSMLAFTSEMARLQQAIAEWHDLVFGAVRPSRR